ncbi:MAG TPA: ferrochelatase [Acidobacteriota bacterium]|nr:ferrochelatase [Acidobacteriota bacterium]
MARAAVLLMAYGGPSSLDEVEAYVMDVRGGRPLAPALLEEIKERYRKIGGRSPLLAITQRQAMALEEELERGGVQVQVFVGMRHWFPYIRDAVQAIVSRGLQRVVAICMTPHFSKLSVGAYFNQYDAAVKESGAALQTTYVRDWHTRNELIRAYAARVSEAIQLFSAEEQRSLELLFTAHSLPKSRLEPDDPYDAQQRETAALVAKRFGDLKWSLAYQSEGYTKDTWLGPRAEDKIRELAEAGVRNVLVVPTGFLCDHVEILYDIDIQLKGLASRLGIRLERSMSLNDDPLLIKALAAVVTSALKGQV